ncbi:MAG TPA: hypothetical protein VN915_16385 [Elusimicrobiota bacterium]|nr:hypothetical protein [Elusimicrobiota bacterium]
MEPLPLDPALTEQFERSDLFVAPSNSVYIFARSGEARAKHVDGFDKNKVASEFVEVWEQRQWTIDYLRRGNRHSLQLRSNSDLKEFWAKIERDVCYLDITGLAHHVWAPLLNAAIREGRDIRLVYVQPAEYRYNPNPTEAQIFDLSDAKRGTAPLPGFALLEEKNSHYVFVPLLGFEGVRLKALLSEFEPPEEKIVPIIGIPGFQAEYPFHTYLGNKVPLSESRCWGAAYYARADCPFSIYAILKKIANERQGEVLKIAPIGTKPHAVGAVLFKIRNWQRVELVYDHPERKPDRTSGASRMLVYHLKGALGI